MPNDLTARELEVLRLVVRGSSDAKAAKTLLMDAKHVTTHLANIRAKLGVETREELVAKAKETGLS